MHTHIRLILCAVTLAMVGCGSGGTGNGSDDVPTPPEGPVRKLFVLTGQSNALGVTNGGEIDPTTGSDPADAHIGFFWDNVADAATSLGTSGGDFATIQDQQGGFYAGSATHWGPEVELARSLYRAGMRDFGIIKASRGGGGNTNWSKPAGGHMYTHVVDTVLAATAKLDSGDVAFEIVGLLYVQGESDSASEAGIADERLDSFIDNLRVDLPNAANMQAFVGGIAAAGGNRDTVRSNQASFAAGDPSVHYFDTVDLQASLHDGLHFNKAAKLTVGARFAHAVISAGCHTPTYGNLVFVGDSITQGGNGHASFRYEVFRHLVHQSAEFAFVGSLTGAAASIDLSGVTPAFQGQAFRNVHDGHFGWRAFWVNGRVPLPATRRGHNVGEGTLMNWTGQALEYELNFPGNVVPYPDPAAIGTGSTETTYTPNTALVMIGINDLADGSPPAQVCDDIGTIVDQLRGSNPSVRIHVCRVLHTNQNNPTLQTNVDALNGLIADMVATKNAASSTSPVWITDPSTGFNPALLTYDAVHPNVTGEAFVGQRVARGLGLLGEPLPGPPPPNVERDIADFSDCFEGNEIFDGMQFVNGWTESIPAATTEVLVGDDLTDLRREHLDGSAAILEGTSTGWNSANNGSWTLEARIRVQTAPNGFYLWLGTDSNLILIEIHDNGTRGFSGGFDATHVNDDGNFHTFRIAHDVANQRYHVWRDGVRLTPTDGAAYDLGNDESRLILGDWTSGAAGDFYDVDIDYVCFDQSGAYVPSGG